MLIKKGGIVRNINESRFNEYANKGYMICEDAKKTSKTEDKQKDEPKDGALKKKSAEKG